MSEMLNDKGVICEELKTYLDNLRDSAIINMFGAAPFLMRDFGFTKYEAKDELLRWMHREH